MLVMLWSILAGLSLAQVRGSEGPELTVYNQGMALVKEVRAFDLHQGKQTLSISDVAAQIDPSSVSIASLSSPEGLSVLEQNYRLDLIGVLAILNKSVGGRVAFIRHTGGKIERLEGTLISSPTSIVNGADGGHTQVYNGMVIKADDGTVYLNPIGEIVVRSVPKGLISVPTLFWDINAKAAGPNSIELSYVTNGFRWNADYVLTLDAASNLSDLQGWVTMTNNCGATYTKAKLKLLAGSINRVARNGITHITFDAAANQLLMEGANRPFKEESLFEYHLYTLQRPTTIRDREIKQLSLLEVHKVAWQKRLVLDSQDGLGSSYPQEGAVGIRTIQPQIKIEFVNSEENNLGMALPAGKFRVYQRDASGSIQLLGEDVIDHTPRNERVSLAIGRSFDVVANRRRTYYHRDSARTVGETFEISVRNRKDTTETVDVLERHYFDWKVTNSSEKWTKEDANTMKFIVTLKPNESRKITYTVQTNSA